MKYKVLTPHGWVKSKNLTPLHTVFVKDKGFVPFEPTVDKQELQVNKCLSPYYLEYNHDLPFDIILTVLEAYSGENAEEGGVRFEMLREHQFTFLKELCERNNLTFRTQKPSQYWNLTVVTDLNLIARRPLEKIISLEGRDTSLYKSIAELINFWYEGIPFEDEFWFALCAAGGLLGESESTSDVVVASFKNLPKVDGKLLILSDSEDSETVLWV